MQDILLHEYAAELFPPTDSWEITAGFAGITVQELIWQALTQPTRLKVIDVKGMGGELDTRSDVKLIPGHVWSDVLGPQPADVMVIGKMPGQQELLNERNLVGPAGDCLRDAFRAAGADWEQFYVTNVLHFMPPDGGSKLRAYHVKDCSTLLMHELLVVNPRYILLLGVDAIKFLFGRKATLSSTRGAVIPIRLGSDIGKMPSVHAARDDWDKVEIAHSTYVMTTVNPAHVLREPRTAPGFEADIQAFSELVAGRRSAVFVTPASKHNYQYISDAETLNTLVDKLIADGVTELAVDCEWGGTDYKTGWLRTVQFSWAPGKAAVVILRNCESQRGVVFKPTGFHAIDALHRLIDRPGVHIYGQNFRSDALWLEDMGLRVMSRLTFDTMLADHALNESQEHGLTAMTVRYTDMGRYDIELVQWVKNNPCPDGGYGSIPDDILHPYAAADADAQMRITLVLRAELERPANASVKKLFYEVILPSCQPIHEMEMTGIRVDPDRMIDLLWQYDTRKKELLQELRGMISWPDFNPRSFIQKAKLLFEPPEAGGLGLMPIKSTEKPSREWPDILKLPPEERARINPSTDAESLELLAVEAPTERTQKVVETLQNSQIIDQVTKNFLRPPAGATLDETFLPEHFERADYTEGLLGHTADDGRIHTTISQIKETGRHGSSNPNLQNISKRQEPRYQEIMGYKIPKIRSCFVASPGYVLVEADYKSAEIVTLAYISGDQQLIADALGPVKLHSKVAVDILGANCDYSEVAEKFPNLYVGAKNLNFGIPYQRGAKAIARQVNRETKGKANMTEDQARSIIDSWYERYALVSDYVDWCKRHVNHPPHYLETPWGRRRHFYVSPSNSVMAAQEREAVNFTIQGTVADALNKALYNLWAYRRQHPEYAYRILMAIHDAVLLEVPIGILEPVVDEILPLCMTYGARIPQGERNISFQLDIDSEVMFRWGETPKRKELGLVGVPEKYWPKEAA